METKWAGILNLAIEIMLNRQPSKPVNNKLIQISSTKPGGGGQALLLDFIMNWSDVGLKNNYQKATSFPKHALADMHT